MTMVSRFTALKYEALNLADESTDLTFRTSLKNSNLVPVSASPPARPKSGHKGSELF